MAAPNLDAVKEYMGATALTYSDASIGKALAAETLAQARVCVVEWAEPVDDLAEALCRRVARNLAMRRLPLGVMSDESGATRLGSTDPEVRRLEGPHRRRVMG